MNTSFSFDVSMESPHSIEEDSLDEENSVFAPRSSLRRNFIEEIHNSPTLSRKCIAKMHAERSPSLSPIAGFLSSDYSDFHCLEPDDTDDIDIPTPRFQPALVENMFASLKPPRSPHVKRLRTKIYHHPTNIDIICRDMNDSGNESVQKGLSPSMDLEHSDLDNSNNTSGVDAGSESPCSHADEDKSSANFPATPPSGRFQSLQLGASPGSEHDLHVCLFGKRNKRHRKSPKESTPLANTNIFLSGSLKKEIRSIMKGNCDSSHDGDEFGDEDECDHYSVKPKKLLKREVNVRRFAQEFHIVEKIGEGDFGQVYKCLNRIDGVLYAVKRNMMKSNSIRETFALSAVNHPNVVRYYSSWIEDNYLFIQTEYCNGGNLSHFCQMHGAFVEDELVDLLWQLASGLEHIHSKGLSHMDIKPDNILIETSQVTIHNDSGIDDSHSDAITYKICDFGCVMSKSNRHDQEGDGRFLAFEALNDIEKCDLFKVDVYSLGLTVWSCGKGVAAPCEDLTADIRCEGKLPFLPHLSYEFNRLLKSMVNPNPEQRPSVKDILSRSHLASLNTRCRPHSSSFY